MPLATLPSWKLPPDWIGGWVGPRGDGNKVVERKIPFMALPSSP